MLRSSGGLVLSHSRSLTIHTSSMLQHHDAERFNSMIHARIRYEVTKKLTLLVPLVTTKSRTMTFFSFLWSCPIQFFLLSPSSHDLTSRKWSLNSTKSLLWHTIKSRASKFAVICIMKLQLSLQKRTNASHSPRRHITNVVQDIRVRCWSEMQRQTGWTDDQKVCMYAKLICLWRITPAARCKRGDAAHDARRRGTNQSIERVSPVDKD